VKTAVVVCAEVKGIELVAQLECDVVVSESEAPGPSLGHFHFLEHHLRGRSASLTSTQQSSLYQRTSLSPKLPNTVKMSDEDGGDLGERVTMPFKFVTGTFQASASRSSIS
jgi:hypothetical protein